MDQPLACRAAGLAFLDGVAAGWQKYELAMWLLGPYREAAVPMDAHPHVPHEPRASQGEPLDEDRIDRILREARWHVLAALEAAALPGARGAHRSHSSHHKMVDVALAAGHLVARHDGDGRVAWLPVDLRGMRLRQRVESLFAADYLVHPRDYLTELTVCHRCEKVLFDASARRRGDCGMHMKRVVALESGVR